MYEVTVEADFSSGHARGTKATRQQHTMSSQNPLGRKQTFPTQRCANLFLLSMQYPTAMSLSIDSGGAKRREKTKERGDRAPRKDFHIPIDNAVQTALQTERVLHLRGSLFIKRGSFWLTRSRLDA